MCLKDSLSVVATENSFICIQKKSFVWLFCVVDAWISAFIFFCEGEMQCEQFSVLKIAGMKRSWVGEVFEIFRIKMRRRTSK